MKGGIKILALIFLMFAFQKIQAQQTITITDAETTEPLSDVSIDIRSANDNNLSEAIHTDTAGTAVISIAPPFEIFVFTTGYQPYQAMIENTNDIQIHLQILSQQISEFTVTGQYDVVSKDQSVYNVKVIDKKTIDQKSANNLKQLLENELGIRINQDNILGSSITINGITGQNVKVLIDGVPMIGRENGNLDLSSINLNNIQRVELIEGPMSVMYGTDALGGVINLITNSGSFHPFELDGNFAFESTGTYNADGSLFIRHKNNNLELNGGRYFFDGFNLPDTGRYQTFKPKEQIFINGQYSYKSRDFDFRYKIDASAQTIQNKGVPAINPYSAYAFDDYYYTNRINNTMFNEYRMNNNSKLTFTNSFSVYQHIKNTYRKDLVDLTQALVNQQGSQDTTVFTSWLLRGAWSNVNPFHQITFQTGYDINLDKGIGIKLTNGLQHIYDFALFGSLDYKWNDHISLRPGIRIIYNTRYGAPVVPSINALFVIRKNYSLRLGYSRGFRSPSLKELDLFFVDANHNITGNENLIAETSNNLQASLSIKNAIEDFPLTFEVSSFYNNIQNIITLALVNQTSQLFTYVNIDRYETTGLNFSASFSNDKFSYNTGFQMLGTYNSLSENYSGVTHFSMTPEFQNDFTIHLLKYKSDISIYFKNVGTTPGFALDDQQQTYETFIQPYSIVDITLMKKCFKDLCSFNFGIKNVLNVVNISTNSLATSVHSENSGFLPYAMGRYIFADIHFKIYNSEK